MFTLEFHAILGIILPIFAIVLSLVTKRIIVALSCAAFLGHLLHSGLGGVLTFLQSIVKNVTDVGHLQILAFTFFMSIMVGWMDISGSLSSIVFKLTARIKTRRQVGVSSALLGTAFFFDDYASVMICGNTLRPLTDKFRISRQKLAYLIDSTSAPIASLAVVSTWIAYELSMMEESMKSSGLTFEPMQVFLDGLPYRFYPIIALIITLLVAVFNINIGPMKKAEREARTDSKKEDTTIDHDTTERKHAPFIYAALPIGALLILMFLFMLIGPHLFSGLPAYIDAGMPLRIHPDYDPYASLVWSSLLGAAFALFGAIRNKQQQQLMKGAQKALHEMKDIFIILVLAWTFAELINTLEAGKTIASLIPSDLNIRTLPLITFVLSGLVAFSTGTSWGTMAILFPIVTPILVSQTGTNFIEGSTEYTLLASTMSAILAGAVWGDHCSPLSDTTILSAAAAGTTVVDHVNTQWPYAIIGAVIAVICGYIPYIFDLGIPFILLFSSIVLALSVFGYRLRYTE